MVGAQEAGGVEEEGRAFEKGFSHCDRKFKIGVCKSNNDGQYLYSLWRRNGIGLDEG
jgi:hypothetical protein